MQLCCYAALLVCVFLVCSFVGLRFCDYVVLFGLRFCDYVVLFGMRLCGCAFCWFAVFWYAALLVCGFVTMLFCLVCGFVTMLFCLVCGFVAVRFVGLRFCCCGIENGDLFGRMCGV